MKKKSKITEDQAPLSKNYPHKVVEIANALKLRIGVRQEPTTGYWLAYIGHNCGDSIMLGVDVPADHKTAEVALDMLLLAIRDKITD